MATLSARLSIYSDAELLGFLNGLAMASLANLREADAAGRPVPPLYRAGVRYQRERPGKEDWQLPTTTLRLRSGDCEDLAGWLCAAYWQTDEDPRARMFLKRVNPRLRHIQVMRGDGTIEDPSAMLGMRGRG